MKHPEASRLGMGISPKVAPFLLLVGCSVMLLITVPKLEVLGALLLGAALVVFRPTAGRPSGSELRYYDDDRSEHVAVPFVAALALVADEDGDLYAISVGDEQGGHADCAQITASLGAFLTRHQGDIERRSLDFLRALDE